MDILLPFFLNLFFIKKKEVNLIWISIFLILLFNFSWNSLMINCSMNINLTMLFLIGMVFFMGQMCIQNMSFMLEIISLSSYLFFLSLNFMILFFSFEISLIPILFIIFLWGIQPERISAFYFLLIYTIFSSFPLFFSILMLSNQNLILFWSIQSISLICFSFSFLVKLPMFFFHIWLPKAHVEAPTLGSIILAGLLLKLGGFGICFIMKVFINIYSIILIFISSLGCLISCFICCFQSDGKALIAFSSVCHLNFMLFSLLTLFSLSKTFSIFCMLIHGLNSSFMFWLAGTLSHWSLSRNIIWLNSLSTFSISILMMSTFIFLSNFGVPPSLSIFQEIIFFSCIMNSFWFLFFINLIYLMLVCYFSLYILICLNLKQFFQKTICWINMELFNFFMVFMMMNFILLFLN